MSEVAVVGMAVRVPDATTVDELWANIVDGRSSITSLESPATADGGARIIQARGLITDIDKFDAPFFEIPGREAELLDPQHRLFLELVWEALEDAGLAGEELGERRVGVYASAGANTYLAATRPPTRSPAEKLLAYLSNIGDTMPTRASYRLGLTGESVNVQTACSSSLVAMRFACESLRSGQTDVAVVGGVSIRVANDIGYDYQPGLIYSADGRCLPFDSRASGTVDGDGGAVVVLRCVDDVSREGHHCYAVVKAIAVNNDAAAKVGFTAPSVRGQAEVVSAALRAARVSPETIRYVEAHGTGTALGDPIEVAALAQAFERSSGKRGACALGSIKANIGHLGFAAGIIGFVKAALVVERGVIPPSPYFGEPNPEIDLESSPFFVPKRAEQWSEDARPRRAGVSSFGVGGTNVHAILEEAPRTSVGAQVDAPVLVTLSARSESALNELRSRLAEHLVRNPELDVGNVAYTLNVGRRAFDVRWGAIARDCDDLLRSLRLTDARADDADAPDQLRDALHAWLAHRPVDFRTLSEKERRLRVRLPTYPFERASYWPDRAAFSGDAQSLQRADLSDWFYERRWRRALAIDPGGRPGDGAWLVVGDGSPTAEALVERLHAEREVVSIEPGTAFQRLAESRYALGLASEDDFDRLADEGVFSRVRHVVYMPGLEEAAPPRVASDAAGRRLWTLFLVARLLNHLGQPVRLSVVTCGACAVGDAAFPAGVEHAPLVAASRIVSQEHPQISCRVIDLGPCVPARRSAGHLVAELAAGGDEMVVAYRADTRWVERLAPLRLRAPEEPVLKQGGVYVVTGGLGRIGLILAEHLARRYQATLVLVGRSQLPGETGPEGETTGDEVIAARQSTVARLREIGSKVVVRAADVADSEALRAVFEETVASFGAIDGVFHAAGVDEGEHFEFISETTLDLIERVFAPKVAGTLILRDVLAEFPVGFCVLFSSLSTTLGGIAFGAYTAANGFMDAVGARAAAQGEAWVTVNWDTWNVPRAAKIGAAVSPDSIRPGEGVESLERILAAGATQVTVSTFPLEGRMRRVREVLDEQRPTAAHAPAPADASGVAATVQAVLSDLLQAPSIGLDEDLIEIGCDSLLFVETVAELEQRLGVTVPISEVWGAVTVGDLVELCADMLGVPPDGTSEEPREPLTAA